MPESSAGDAAGAALLRMLEVLEDEDARALAQHEAVAVAVERARPWPGSSFLSESALQGAEAAHPERFTHASAPPAIITSALSERVLPASPMAAGLVVHAEIHRVLRAPSP